MTEKPKIGDSGSPDNVGQASRAPHIKIDKARIRKYDKRRGWMLRSALGWSALTLGLVGLGVWLFFVLTWWSILLGLLALGGAWLAGQLAVIPWPALMNRYEMYWDSSLCGAVVVRTNPTVAVTLMNLDTSGVTKYKYFDMDGREVSLQEYDAEHAKWEQEWDEEWEDKYIAEEDSEAADRMYDEFWDPFHDRYTATEDETDGKWGCRLVEVGEGDWSLRVGDRIPCSSAFGYPDPEREVWRHFNALPLLWATKDKTELDACIQTISGYEWELLAQVAAATEREGLSMEKTYLIHLSETGDIVFEALNVDDEEEESEEE